jgi:hypothetical protein
MVPSKNDLLSHYAAGIRNKVYINLGKLDYRKYDGSPSSRLVCEALMLRRRCVNEFEGEFRAEFTSSFLPRSIITTHDVITAIARNVASL